MAVYTQVSAEALAALPRALRRRRAGLGQGHRRGGREFSNYLVDTTARPLHPDAVRKARRWRTTCPSSWRCSIISPTKGLPVPPRDPRPRRRADPELEGRPACLIEFLPGVSVVAPDPGAGARRRRGAGRDARARSRDFARTRAELDGRRRLARAVRALRRAISTRSRPGLYDAWRRELDDRRRALAAPTCRRSVDPRRPVPRQRADARRRGHRADRLLLRLHRHPRLRSGGDAQPPGAFDADGQRLSTPQSATR